MKRLLPFLCLCLYLPLSTIGQLYEIKEHNKWGLMDATGKVVLSPRYDYLYPAEDDRYFLTQLKGKSGLYHIEHGEIIKPAYDQIFVEKERGGALLIVIKGKYGVLNPNDNSRISPEYDEIRLLQEGVYAVRKGKLWGIESLSKQIQIPLDYRRIITFEEGNALFYCGYDSNGNSHIWDQTGKAHITDIPYRIYDYLSGIFIYRKNRRCGILGNSREALTEPIFDRIKPMGDLLIAQQGRKYGLLSIAGEVRLPVDYLKIRTDTTGHYWVFDGTKWGVADLEGRLVVEPRFSAPSFFEGPVSRIRIGRAYGVINLAGEYVLEPSYRAVRLYPGLVRYFQDSTWAQVRFDETGKLVRSRKLIIAQNSGAYKFMRTRSLQSEEDLLSQYGWFQAKGRWGLRDTLRGNLRIKPRYDSVSVHPRHRLSIAGTQSYSPRNARYGLVSHRTHDFLYRPFYSHLYLSDLDSTKGLRARNQNGGYDLLFPFARPSYRDHPEYFKNLSFAGEPVSGVWRVRLGGKKAKPIDPDSPNLEQQLIDSKGAWTLVDAESYLSLANYSYISPIVNQVCRFRKNKKWGLFHLTEKVILAPSFEYIDDPEPEAQYLITEMSGTKYSFLDGEGNFLFEKHADSLGNQKRPGAVVRVGEFGEGLLPAQINRAWGYFDKQGNLAIKPQFKRANTFHEGLAAAKGKVGWGFIDKQGDWVIKGKKKPLFRTVSHFQEGLAAVKKKNNKWGYITPTGKYQINAKYRNVSPFNSGLAVVKVKKWGIINKAGKWVLKPIYNKIEAQEGGFLVNQDGQYGFFSEEGTWLIEPTYQQIIPSSNGEMVFQDQNLYGLLDRTGNVLLPARYRRLKPASEGLAAVRQDRTWGFMDLHGDIVIPSQYDQARSFADGIALVAGGKPRRWGVINLTGDTIVDLVYERITHLAGGWLACRTRDSLTQASKWVYLDRYGVPINQADFGEAKPIRGMSLSILTRNEKEYVIHFNGQPLTNPGYDNILSVKKEIIVGESQNLWGLIDRGGEELFPPQFEQIRFRQGLYQVSLNGKLGYLDNRGKWIRPLTE